jgi:hypothetical protein
MPFVDKDAAEEQVNQLPRSMDSEHLLGIIEDQQLQLHPQR